MSHIYREWGLHLLDGKLDALMLCCCVVAGVRRHLCSILALCSPSQLSVFSGLRGVTLPASAVRALDVRRWASEVVKRCGCSDYGPIMIYMYGSMMNLGVGLRIFETAENQRDRESGGSLRSRQQSKCHLDTRVGLEEVIRVRALQIMVGVVSRRYI